MTYHPKNIMTCALFLATKADNYYLSLRRFAAGLPSDTPPEDIIAPEFLLMQGLRFTLDVRHPFRGLEGGIMELHAIAQGSGTPAPHALPQQTPDSLRRDLLALPPAPGASQSKSISDRLARAHTTTRETLKSASQMTDAYFLYTPSQIWLAAFSLADAPLAEFYLSSKLSPPEPETDTNHLFHELRTKISSTISACATLLASYTPSTSDAQQMKNLKRIAKKRHHCENPEKANLSAGAGGQKRIPDAAMRTGTPGLGGDGTSESEVERMAKKRRLEREKRESEGRDLFGGEIVAERTKLRQQQEINQNQSQQGEGG